MSMAVAAVFDSRIVSGCYSCRVWLSTDLNLNTIYFLLYLMFPKYKIRRGFVMGSSPVLLFFAPSGTVRTRDESRGAKNNKTGLLP
jgi:hypothetical protein